LIRARYGGAMSGWMRLVGLVPRPLMGWILSQDFRRLRALISSEHQTAREIVHADLTSGLP
jgi:hypothetical protein